MTLNEFDRESPYARNIQWERQSLFVDEVQPRMVVSGLGASLLGVLMSQNLGMVELMVWLAICFVVSLGSYLVLTKQRRILGRAFDNNHVYRLVYWHRVNLLIALTWGVLWSVGPWLFLDGANQSQVFALLLFVMVMSSMPSVTMGTYPDIFLLFIIPVFSSLFILLWPSSTPLLLAVAAMSGLSLAVFSLMTHKRQMNSIRLRLEHQLARQQASEADQAKSRFLAAASHDLRQPLQAANLYLQAFQGRLLEPDELLDKAKESVSSANDLLTKLLDMSLIDADVVTVTVQNCYLGNILHSLETEFTPLALEKGLALDITPAPIQVSTDPVLLLQILRNLLDNAIKYTESGSVSVSLELRGEQASLRIEDTGSGIAESEQRDVFKEFYRTAHTRKSEPGIGLGLSIVRRLCEQLRLELNMISVPGEGTRFSLSLPICLDAAISTLPGEPVAPLPEHFTALVVDDHEQVRDALSAMLVEWNGDVWAASDHAELTMLLEQMTSAPDVLLTDDMLADGHRSEDCIQTVQAFFPGTCCVVLTGNTSLGGIQRLSHAHWPVLHKPIDSSVLQGTLSRLLASKRVSASK